MVRVALSTLTLAVLAFGSLKPRSFLLDCSPYNESPF